MTAPRTMIVKATVPLYVYVVDGKVVRAVGHDERPSEPEAIIVPPEGVDLLCDDFSWSDSDEQPITEEQRQAYEQAKHGSGAWPAWEWGF